MKTPRDKGDKESGGGKKELREGGVQTKNTEWVEWKKQNKKNKREVILTKGCRITIEQSPL
jgi:hypothetical protein